MEWNKSAKEVSFCKHGASIQQHYIISSTEFSYSMTYHSVKTLTQGTTDPISSVLHFNLSAACVAERALPTLAGCWHLFLSSEPAAATQHEAGLEEALRFFKSTLKMLIVLNCAVWHWEAVFTLFFCWEVNMTMMTFPLTNVTLADSNAKLKVTTYGKYDKNNPGLWSCWNTIRQEWVKVPLPEDSVPTCL